MGVFDFLKGKKKNKKTNEAEKPELDELEDGGDTSAEDVPAEEAEAPQVEAPQVEVLKEEPEEDVAQEEIAQEEPVVAPEPLEELPEEVSEEVSEEETPEEKPAKKSWFGRLKEGLGKSASKITSGLAEAIGKPKLDASDLDEIEDALIMADLGVAAAGRLTEGLKKRSFPDGVTKDSLAQALAEEVAEILTPVA